MQNVKALYQTDEILALEKIANDRYQLTSTILMERAGMAAFKALREKWREHKRVTIVCGGGNNGGDGYILASVAHKANLAVQVLSLQNPETLTGPAKEAYLLAQKSKVRIEEFDPTVLANCDVIIDAIFGIGFHGNVTGLAKMAIEAINATGLAVLSLDVPSGLNADTGAIGGTAVRATLTISFIAAKPGFYTLQGPAVTGEIKVDTISLPEEIFQVVPAKAELIDYQELAQKLLPGRAKFQHKGNFGHVLLVGGDEGMPGAIRMAGESALRVGAGLATVLTRKEHVITVTAARPELMCYGVNIYHLWLLREVIDRGTVIALGPGLGKKCFGKRLFKEFTKMKKPMVLDADALNLLANKNRWFINSFRKRNLAILTPHPGEAARLLKTSVANIQNDRFAAVRQLQSKFGGVIVLKGAGTLICNSDGKVFVCPYGNPGMAKGGQGDVLTGILAGLLAQGLTLADAALLGTAMHSLAADRAITHISERSLLASDVVEELKVTN